MKSDDSRMMHLAGTAGLLALTGIAYAVCIHPTVRKSRLEQEARTQSVFVREDLEKVEKEYESAVARQAGLESQLQSTFETMSISMLNDKSGRIVSLAERCGVSVSRLRPGEPTKRAALTDVPLSMTGECEYQTFHAFLALLRVEAPDVELESFDLNSDGSTGAEFRAKFIWHACNDSSAVDSLKNTKGS